MLLAVSLQISQQTMVLKRSISSKFKDTLTKTKNLISHQQSDSTSSQSSGSATSVGGSNESSITSLPSLDKSKTFEDTDYPFGVPVHRGSGSRRQSSVSLRSSISIRRPSRSRSGTTSAGTATGSGSGLLISSAMKKDSTSLDQHTPPVGPRPEQDSLEDPLLLPTVDKSVPPCTTEELTPIIPMTFEELRRSLPHDKPVDDTCYINHSTPGSPISTRKRPLIISTLSTSSAAVTLSSDGTPGNVTYGSDHYFEDVNSSPNSSVPSPHFNMGCFQSTNTNSNNNNNLYSALERQDFKDHIDPVFLKANQIDHYDNALDCKTNDKLADQMALNILQNIEEECDELAKFREEIAGH